MTPDMTIRDWFAGNAQVAIGHWSTRDKFPLSKDGLTYEQLIGHPAYAMADALHADRGVKAGAEAASEGQAGAPSVGVRRGRNGRKSFAYWN